MTLFELSHLAPEGVDALLANESWERDHGWIARLRGCGKAAAADFSCRPEFGHTHERAERIAVVTSERTSSAQISGGHAPNRMGQRAAVLAAT